MSFYNKIFKNIYPGGWKKLPSKDTPLTAETMNQYNNTIRNIETYLSENEIPQQLDMHDNNFADVWSYDFQNDNLQNRDAIIVNGRYGKETEWITKPFWSVTQVPQSGSLSMPKNPNTSGYISDTTTFANLRGGFYKLASFILFHYRFEVIADFINSELYVIKGLDVTPTYTGQQLFAVRESDGQLAAVKFDNNSLIMYKDISDMKGTWNLSYLAQGN